MARDNDNIQYLTINDFSPGIRPDFRLTSSSNSQPPYAVSPAIKPGEAAFHLNATLTPNSGGGTQDFFTRGFVSNDQGNLVPGPYLQWDSPATTVPNTVGDTFLDVAGFRVAPILSGTGGNYTDAWYVWLHVVNNTPRDALRFWRLGGGTGSVLINTNAGTLAVAGPPRGVTHILSRGRRATFATPAGPELFYEWTSGVPFIDGSVMFYDVHPDPTVPNADNVFQETGVVNNAALLLGGQILAHNGRIIRLCEQQHAFGLPAAAAAWSNERVRNTDPPNSVSLAGTTTDSILDPQNPSIYGAWGSLTYGELLVIKQFGGALLIEGDVYAPQITRLPGVHGTGIHVSEMAQCAAGLVYMTDDGPYLWSGGSTSQRLGYPAGGAILPLFNNYIGQGGSGITCSVQPFNNFVVFSGGAMWDSIHHSWWALEVPYITIPIQFFAASQTATAILYGITSAQGNTGKVEIYRWRPTQQSGHLGKAEWLSQPIPTAYDTIDITSVEVTCSYLPADNTDVTLALYMMTIDNQMQFVANVSPESGIGNVWKFRIPLGIRATHIWPYILLFNNNGNIPIITEIVFGYREAGSVGRTGVTQI
jgi:hypothetical protein